MINDSLKILILTLLTSFYNLNFIESKTLGDLTKQKPIEKLITMNGINGKVHYFSPNILNFKTGKLYKLKIKNVSDSKHYFSSENFSNSIFTRKVQVIQNNQKIAEVKGNIKEVEVFPNNTLEWWFVPVKTGEFNDLNCSVEDPKTKEKHSNMGMTGKIIIE